MSIFGRRNSNRPLEVAIEHSCLVIRIGIERLAFCYENSTFNRMHIDNQNDYFKAFAVTNPRQFAKDIIAALQIEKGDGSTPVHVLLYDASVAAVENGSRGVEDISWRRRRRQKLPEVKHEDQHLY